MHRRASLRIPNIDCFEFEFDKIVNNERTFKLFEDFAKKEMNEENVAFLKLYPSLINLIYSAPLPRLVQEFEQVKKQFFVPYSPKELNLSGAVRTQVFSVLQTLFTNQNSQDAALVLRIRRDLENNIKLIHTGCITALASVFMRFKRSEKFVQFINACNPQVLHGLGTHKSEIEAILLECSDFERNFITEKDIMFSQLLLKDYHYWKIIYAKLNQMCFINSHNFVNTAVQQKYGFFATVKYVRTFENITPLEMLSIDWNNNLRKITCPNCYDSRLVEYNSQEQQLHLQIEKQQLNVPSLCLDAMNSKIEAFQLSPRRRSRSLSPKFSLDKLFKGPENKVDIMIQSPTMLGPKTPRQGNNSPMCEKQEQYFVETAQSPVSSKVTSPTSPVFIGNGVMDDDSLMTPVFESPSSNPTTPTKSKISVATPTSPINENFNLIHYNNNTFERFEPNQVVSSLVFSEKTMVSGSLARKLISDRDFVSVVSAFPDPSDPLHSILLIIRSCEHLQTPVDKSGKTVRCHIWGCVQYKYNPSNHTTTKIQVVLNNPQGRLKYTGPQENVIARTIFKNLCKEETKSLNAAIEAWKTQQQEPIPDSSASQVLPIQQPPQLPEDSFMVRKCFQDNVQLYTKNKEFKYSSKIIGVAMPTVESL